MAGSKGEGIGRDLGKFDGERTAGPKGHFHSCGLMLGLGPRQNAKAQV